MQFNKEVGQVVHTTSFTQITNSSDLLSVDERRELNTKVKRLEEIYKKPSKETWVFLHGKLNTVTINEMKKSHFSLANTILELLEEKYFLEKKCLFVESNSSVEEKINNLKTIQIGSLVYLTLLIVFIYIFLK